MRRPRKPAYFGNLSIARCAVASAPFWLAAAASQDLSAQLTINVTNMTELRAAIDTVNASTTNDTINVAAGTYLITGPRQEDSNVSGDLDIAKGAGTLTINGAGAGTTRVRGNASDRVLHIVNATSVTINDLAIEDGSGIDNGGSLVQGMGGGILVASGNLTLQDCEFNNNVVAGLNGADGADGTAGAINGGTGGVGAQAHGGAINMSGTGNLTITNCTFTDNDALGGSGGNGGDGFDNPAGSTGGNGGIPGSGGLAAGGAIFFAASGTLSISSSTLQGNLASGGPGGAGGDGGDDAAALGSDGGDGGNGFGGGNALGGGICIVSGVLDLTSVTIRDGIATGGVGGAGGAGGAGYNLDGNAGSGGFGGDGIGAGIFANAGTMLSITRSTISGNTASGAIGGNGGDCAGFTASTAGDGGNGGNGGDGQGGGIWADTATVDIICSTISGNLADGADGGNGGDGGDPFTASNAAGNGGDAGNGGNGQGAGIYVSTNSTLDIDNSTIAAHVTGSSFGGVGGLAGVGTGATNGLNGIDGSSQGGGVWDDGSGTLTIDSTIIADNSANTGPDLRAAATAGSSLFETTPTGLITLSGSGANIVGTDPGLSTLGNFGGPGRTHRISETSVARNVGSNALSLLFDQRGENRDDGNGVDMGALEFTAGVDDSGDSGNDDGGEDGSCSTGDSRSSWLLLGGLMAACTAFARRLRAGRTKPARHSNS
jgi:hypothetical protein